MNTLSNNIFDRATKRGGPGHYHDDQDIEDSASVCVQPDTITGTHAGESSIKSSADMYYSKIIAGVLNMKNTNQSLNKSLQTSLSFSTS